jgi:hypothetical protein
MKRTLGVDVATHVSVEQWKRFVDSGYSFAVVRCYRNKRPGIVDDACPATITNAVAAGINDIDVYHYPFLKKEPESQARATLEFLRKNEVRFNRIFLDVERTDTPWTTPAKNLDFIRRFVAVLEKEQVTVGIYTDTADWKRFTDDSAEFSRLPLWWSSHGNAFKPFGGWKKPTITQIRYEQHLGGVDHDVNERDDELASGAGVTSESALAAEAPTPTEPSLVAQKTSASNNPALAFDNDVIVHDRYQAFASELSRISLLGIAAIGFLVTKAPFASDVTHGPSKAALWVSLSGLSVAAFASLLHRYFGPDSLGDHLEVLRHHARGTNASKKKGARDMKLKLCSVLLLTAAVSLVVGAGGIAVAFGLLLN